MNGGRDGTVLFSHTQANEALDRLKRICAGRDLPDSGAYARFDKACRNGEDLRGLHRQLSAAVSAIVDKSEERALASLFSPGGTHALKGELAGVNDFEVLAWLVVLPEEAGRNDAKHPIRRAEET